MSAQTSVAKEYEKYLEADAAARLAWEESERQLLKVVKVAKLGRRSQVMVSLSESRGVRIIDRWRTAMREGEVKSFAPAFSKRYELKEVPLENQ